MRAIAASLRSASETLIALGPAERVERVGQVLEAWADPASRWREGLSRALADHTGFSPAMVREGADAGFALYTGGALAALAESERPEPLRNPGLCSAFLAGSIPMPTLVAAVAPLCVGYSVVLKPSAADPVSPPWIARSIAETDPLLGACVRVSPGVGADHPELETLLAAECIVATGSDESVGAIAEAAAPGAWVVAHGHRFSAAVVRAEASDTEVIRGLAEDVALWDQLGCLSCIGVWVIADHAAGVDAVAEGLAGELARLETRWPRSPAGAAASLFRDAVEVDAMRADADASLCVHGGAQWCVVRESSAAPRAVPLLRYVRVYPASDLAEVRRALGGDATHLAALAVEGLQPEEEDELRRALRPSRMCGAGSLQMPPLAWRRDHLGVLDSLTPKRDAREARDG